MNEVKPGEIVFCNLTVNHKGKNITLEKVVFKPDNGMFYNKRILDKLKIKEPVKVVKIEVLERLGFEIKYRKVMKTPKKTKDNDRWLRYLEAKKLGISLAEFIEMEKENQTPSK